MSTQLFTDETQPELAELRNTVELVAILSIIGFTEASTFDELCHGLGDAKPDDRREWAELFRRLRVLEGSRLVNITRDKQRVTALQLTHAGAEVVREFRRNNQ